jgi:hypothetical protein
VFEHLAGVIVILATQALVPTDLVVSPLKGEVKGEAGAKQ